MSVQISQIGTILQLVKVCLKMLHYTSSPFAISMRELKNLGIHFKRVVSVPLKQWARKNDPYKWLLKGYGKTALKPPQLCLKRSTICNLLPLHPENTDHRRGLLLMIFFWFLEKIKWSSLLVELWRRFPGKSNTFLCSIEIFFSLLFCW